jgi:pyruvate,water dikinase
MTTTDAAMAPADFPITWEAPWQEQQTWFQDVMHNPLPVTPLAATFFQPAFAEGASRGFASLSMPIVGIRALVQNGYVYLSRESFSEDPAELEARAAEMQGVMMQVAPTILKDWRGTYEPRVLEMRRGILEFDYASKPSAELAAFFLDRRTDLVEAWDIHMKVNIPPMGAVFGLEDMLTGALGDGVLAESRMLLQGFDNKSVETGKTLWSMSRWIRSDDALRTAVMAAVVRQGAVEMEAVPLASEFRQRWHSFLDTYGWRSDRFFELGHKSWHEDPSTPLTQLKGYIAQDDAQDPFAAHADHAREREAREAALEARLPDEMKPVFRMMLPMAQQYIPIAEDHNFTIDQGFTAAMRHAGLQLGRKLAADGVLHDEEDFAYLTADEIRVIADGGAVANVQQAVQSRRREHTRQAALQAPPMIGTPPPADQPPDPLIAKFFGIGHVPSDDANVITGHPCSAGSVTGIAKIVRTLDEADKLMPGDVLVCRMTMPAWTPLFGVAAAVVADSGGPLSHCAIVAREYGIPCVAGTVNGTSVLRDGMLIRVDGTTGIVTVVPAKTRG